MKIKILLAVAISVLLQACGDEHDYLPEVEQATTTTAKIKFIHAASDTVGVNLFFDDIKISGNTASTITTAGSVNLGKVNIGTISFLNAFPVTNYFSTEKSSGTLSVVFPESYNATTTFLTKTMSTAPSPGFAAGSYYTIAFVGVSPNYSTVVFEDNIASVPIDGNAYIRFANFIHNSPAPLSLKGTPPPTAEIPNPTAVTFFTNVAYNGMSEFVALPRTGAYTNIQILNGSTVIATLASDISSFAPNKVYTIFARGRIGASGTPAPGGSRIINR